MAKPRKTASKGRKAVSKTEASLRRKKYANNREIRKYQAQLKDLYQGSPAAVINSKKKTQVEGKKKTAKTIRDSILKKVIDLNEANEGINKQIERRFKKKVRRNLKKVKDKKTYKKGFQTTTYKSWMMKDATDEILKYSEFEGVNTKKNLDEIMMQIDIAFMSMHKYDIFRLIGDLGDDSATYEIIRNG